MKNLNWHKHLRALIIASTLSILLSVAALTAQEQVVPVVDGQQGQCTADFTVKDKDTNPLYDAKIDITFRHGFFGVRKMSLQVGTNSDGRARVIGLPDKSDKTFQFMVSHGDLTETVLMHTAEGCQATFEVVLKNEEASESDVDD
jgi:hypothetical protein